ncbi:hypothetical protein Bbelb_288330 [Branchiostoma belcheri]|nr:hypothetical protein Bbelb_288330 [Branchiostoma belcheri]
MEIKSGKLVEDFGSKVVQYKGPSAIIGGLQGLGVLCVRAVEEVYGKYIPWQCAVKGPRKSAMEVHHLVACCGRAAESRYGRSLGSALWKVRGRALWKVPWQRAVEGPRKRAMEGPLAARCGRATESRYGRCLDSALWKVRRIALWKVFPLAARCTCGRAAESHYGRYIPW